MDILNEKSDKNSFSKPEIEQVQKQKQEYKLIGKYLRTKGLRLFSFNSLRDIELKEVIISTKDEVHLSFNEYGKLAPVDLGMEECQVDSRDIHFEALRMESAVKRVEKWKKGKIKELCNLRNPEELDSIKLY